MPTSRRQRAASSGPGAGSRPSASSTSCEPERDDSARLPCLATTTPQAARMNAAMVETLTEPEPSPPVPQVSSSTGLSVSTRSMRGRIARAAPTISSTVSPFMRSAASKAPICAGVASPSMIWPTTAAIVVGRQPLALDRAWPSASRIVQRALPAHAGPFMAMKLRRRSLPTVVRNDSGWNCTPSTGSVLWRTPMISSSPVLAVISRQSGRLSRSMSSEW